ncbi:Putative prokaryotic extracellular metal-binding protein [Bradyrhizobium sp. ORS 278]|uniref:substrate-binding domain-containing protein n=1 Tax=Bradyrhizobium sp. (strain ORS 278) TaxID=114615 RepID=UPI0001508C0A|nr:substrate-binding domain-containing protein [Bradyrhizobium sp. ORS 278]CAL80161.1 Putative prokaryotic extracellular metal-binding protein [Bradyrhizobium sp. ORS 278]
MSINVAGISSMATRQILAELAAAYEEATGEVITIESVGGVDAAKRIRAGEAFDFAVLASDALQKLEADGHLVPGSIIEIAESPMAMAVRAGRPKPDPLDEAAVRKAMESAKAIGISTGPSGTHVQKLARDWGLESEGSRLVQAKPGIPVAKLLADGEVDVGFQQLSEMLGAPGIDIVGLLPEALQPGTVFAAALCKAGAHADAARAFIEYLVSDETAETKRQHGMTPV